MITPLIEKAVLSGIGNLRNYAIGGSGLCKIEIPKGHFGIITDFVYYPYTYVQNETAGVVLAETETFCFQEICFYINNKIYKYTVKVSHTIYPLDYPALGYAPVNAVNKFDTFIYADADVYIGFKNPQILNGAGFVGDYGLLTNNQNLPAPETVGNTENTVKMIQNAYGDRYYFPSFEETSALNQPTNSTTINANNKAEIYPQTIGGAPTSNIQLPLINVQVLLVAEQNLNKLNT